MRRAMNLKIHIQKKKPENRKTLFTKVHAGVKPFFIITVLKKSVCERAPETPPSTVDCVTNSRLGCFF